VHPLSLALSCSEVLPRFPTFRVAVLVADKMRLQAERPPALDALITEREHAARAGWEGVELSQIPGIAAWRDAYKAFGIKKTSYRSSVERLVKRVKAGERLPAVNTLVDAYNAVSLAHVLCCGADDLDKVEGPLAFRFARPGDSFVDMGAEAGEAPNDPPKAGEVVYADARHVLCRRWNWRQDARTGVSTATTRAVVTIQANGWGDLESAIADFKELVKTYCAGEVRSAIAGPDSPEVTIPTEDDRAGATGRVR
jgi:DNA/RNA-binding domain of Phe-tRNA-synthetase-like protein